LIAVIESGGDGVLPPISSDDGHIDEPWIADISDGTLDFSAGSSRATS
jgi:hypothetical protein